MTQTDPRISKAAEEAVDAFWQVASRHFPEIKSGDIHFSIVIRLNLMAKEAIESWVVSNTPDELSEDGN